MKILIGFLTCLLALVSSTMFAQSFEPRTTEFNVQKATSDPVTCDFLYKLENFVFEGSADSFKITSTPQSLKGENLPPRCESNGRCYDWLEHPSARLSLDSDGYPIVTNSPIKFNLKCYLPGHNIPDDFEATINFTKVSQGKYNVTSTVIKKPSLQK